MNNMSSSFCNVFEWEELIQLSAKTQNRIEGPTNAYSAIRLFGQEEESIRVTLYRDHHAWCPYCQKVWLWLEWKRIPYRTRKVTMYCYGNKETWYLNKVPSGMLPAIEIDNNLFTESDQILLELENKFGPLGLSLECPGILDLRLLERKLFRSWCIWLCQPSLLKKQEQFKQEQFQRFAREMETHIQESNGPWLDPSTTSEINSKPGSVDLIFIPYLERMNASLAYYKGFNLRKEHPLINKWLEALENEPIYRGTQGDMHTHAHDLPPQMGGCYSSINDNQKRFSKSIDIGKGLGEFETTFSNLDDVKENQPQAIALERVIRHKEKIKEVNIIGKEDFDQPLRAALTYMISKEYCLPNKGSAKGLRYLRDRISVPRDMPLLSARFLREALETTASLDSQEQGPKIPLRNRLDQNPEPFIRKNNY